MKRRFFLLKTVGTTLAFTECIQTRDIDSAATPEKTVPTAVATCNGSYPVVMPDADMIMLFINPDGTTVQSEQHVKLEAEGESVIDLSGTTLRFDTEQHYTFSDLQLMPGAEVIVITATDSNAPPGGLDSCPPTYIRNPRFTVSALSDSGTVTLTDAAGTVIIKKPYG